MNVIDSAVCLELEGGRLNADAVLAAMDREGIACSVVAPPDAQAAVHNAEGHAALRALAAAHPGRFAWLAAANPWYGDQALDLLDAAFEAGARGLFLNPARQGFLLTEPVLRPLLDLCARRGKPVYSITGWPVCAEPLQLAELARCYPGLPFVMGRAGYSDFWYDLEAALRQTPNLLLETSCTTPGLIRTALDAVGPDRLLFGSGTPVSSLGAERHKIEWLNLSDAERAAVMETNARRVWSLP